MLDPLPYEAPEPVHAEDVEVVDETEVNPIKPDATSPKADDTNMGKDGEQGSLFD